MPQIPLSKMPNAIYEVPVVIGNRKLKYLQVGYGITPEDQAADAERRTKKDCPLGQIGKAVFWG
jgi:hypothetical protein